ncbi:DJ-1/PfpI family protein [Patescibacteria group bacterium]|nr:DJ-1/PfpI family protein [Patescibacteria group bacterium]
MKKILLLIASEGYQPLEYGEPKRILESDGHEVITVSDKSGVAQAAYDGSSTKVDLNLNDVNIESGDALFLVGGPGALEYLDNEKTYKLLQAWQKSGKPYGAICVSPRILAHAGVLQNKKATGWDGDDGLASIFEKAGVEYVREGVIVDGNVVTGNGPEVAEEFGKVILEVLK